MPWGPLSQRPCSSEGGLLWRHSSTTPRRCARVLPRAPRGFGSRCTNSRRGGLGTGSRAGAQTAGAAPLLRTARDGSKRPRPEKEAPGRSAPPRETAPPGLVTWAPSWLPFPRAASGSSGQDPAPPRGTARYIPGAGGILRQGEPSWHRRAQRPVPRGTAHPAPVSPPLPRGRASLDRQSCGRQPHVVPLDGERVGDAQVSAHPP